MHGTPNPVREYTDAVCGLIDYEWGRFGQLKYECDNMVDGRRAEIVGCDSTTPNSPQKPAYEFRLEQLRDGAFLVAVRAGVDYLLAESLVHTVCNGAVSLCSFFGWEWQFRQEVERRSRYSPCWPRLEQFGDNFDAHSKALQAHDRRFFEENAEEIERCAQKAKIWFQSTVDEFRPALDRLKETVAFVVDAQMPGPAGDDSAWRPLNEFVGENDTITKVTNFLRAHKETIRARPAPPGKKHHREVHAGDWHKVKAELTKKRDTVDIAASAVVEAVSDRDKKFRDLAEKRRKTFG